MTNPGELYHRIGQKPPPDRAHADILIARLARAGHGVISRRELLAAGLSPREIEVRRDTLRLRSIHRGVYATPGAPLTPLGHRRGALLASGAGAILSRNNAAAAHGVADSEPQLVHVTVPHHRRPRPGVLLHRSSIPRDEVELVDGLPTTSISRTLFDLAPHVGEAALAQMFARAEAMRITGAVGLPALLDRYPRRAGRRRIEALLAGEIAAGGATASEFEARVAALLTERPLPPAHRNFDLRGPDGSFFKLDFAWPEVRLAVELDGRAWHRRESQMQSDRARDRALARIGWTTLRFVWEDFATRAAAETALREIAELHDARSRAAS